MTEPTPSSAAGCGCCTADPKTADDVVRDLRAQRDRIERGIKDLDRRQGLVGAAR